MTTFKAHSAEPFHLTPVWLQRWPLARPTIKCLDLLGIAILGPGRCTTPGVHLVGEISPSPVPEHASAGVLDLTRSSGSRSTAMDQSAMDQSPIDHVREQHSQLEGKKDGV